MRKLMNHTHKSFLLFQVYLDKVTCVTVMTSCDWRTETHKTIHVHLQLKSFTTKLLSSYTYIPTVNVNATPTIKKCTKDNSVRVAFFIRGAAKNVDK